MTTETLDARQPCVREPRMTLISLPTPVHADDADASLVYAMAQGDLTALSRLYEAHGRGVLAYLVGQLGDQQLAEEVLQDVMLAAWHGAAAFRGESKVRTWLLAIAHNRAINARRRRVVPLTMVDPVTLNRRNPGPTSTERADHRVDLRAALRALPPEQRAVIDLVLYHGLAIADVAAILEIAPGTVKSRLHRARAALRARLEPDHEPV
jgi:RNA polymerase sigma-70 factor, ECF subfamily